MTISDAPTTLYNESDINRTNLNNNKNEDWLDACSEELDKNEMDELWCFG